MTEVTKYEIGNMEYGGGINTKTATTHFTYFIFHNSNHEAVV